MRCLSVLLEALPHFNYRTDVLSALVPHLSHVDSAAAEHVAGSIANAIKAAYHLLQALEVLEEEWNRRAASDKHFKVVKHPITLNPGIIKGGDWASSVPAWCDVDCRIAVLPGW